MRALIGLVVIGLVGCTEAHRADDDAFVVAEDDAAAPDAFAPDAGCPSGYVSCGGTCVSPSEDPMFCGASPACEGFERCVGNEVCADGRCTLVCDPGLANCAGFCTDPASDPAHCGASLDACEGGTDCESGFFCAFGACVASCPRGLVACFGRCIDPDDDRQYCGVSEECSGGAGTCLSGEVCVMGACVSTCPAGRVACGARCVDPRTDRAYCGAGADCGGGEACASDEVCVDGACAASCPAPQIACGGRCVAPESDRAYCGASSDCTGGSICVAGQVCRAGVCTIVCDPPSVACDGRCVDPRTDASFCGASSTCESGEACDARETCVSGVCACSAPERDCGSGCVDLRFDPANCGGCGTDCAPGEVCAGGVCAVGAPGFTGGFGTEWTTRAFREVGCLEEFVPRGTSDLFVSQGVEFGAYEMVTRGYRAAAPLPFPLPPGRSFAHYGGGIFTITSTDMAFYQPPTDVWRTAPLGMDLGGVGMTISDLDSLWTANSGFLVHASAATSTVEVIAVDTTMLSPRLTYDDVSDRLYFASQASRELRSYQPDTRAFRIESLAPGRIGAAFCGDRAGHVYVGSRDEPTVVWQYTTTTGAWRTLPSLPAGFTGTMGCAIAEVGTLYVAPLLGTTLYELALDRR